MNQRRDHMKLTTWLPAVFVLSALLSVFGSDARTTPQAGVPLDPRASAGPIEPSEILPGGEGGEKRSAPGEYRGYSTPLYDSYRRTSEYVTVRDGTRIAVDIYRPANGGQVTSRRLPTVFLFTAYDRASVNTQTGEFLPNDPMGDHQPGPNLLAHGYVVVVGDARGYGASFGGRTENVLGTVEGRDGADVIGWIARQPWSDGKVGMTGISWPGLVQLFVAAEKPPALKAIFPKMITGPGVLNNVVFGMNGVLWSTMAEIWSHEVDEQQAPEVVQVLPVDADRGGVLLKQAQAQHTSVAKLLQRLFDESQFYRDEPQPAWAATDDLPRRVTQAGVPVYLFGGWEDNRPDIQYHNIGSPKKLTLGFWTHTADLHTEGYADPRAQDSERMERIETLRWFDYWLKGIDNGIMKEPPVHYAVMDMEDRTWSWRDTAQWPPPNAVPRRYYLSGTASGTIESLIDGTLTTERPAESRHVARVDYSATTGERSVLFSHVTGAPVDYGDMSGNDRKGFTYTTAPLTQDVEVIGYPIVELQVTSSEKDEDYLVYLEEIDAQGRSHYITEGAMRGSFRTLGKAPWDTFELPTPSMSAADRRAAAPLNAGPATLRFWLMPTANRFDAGHRIRVTVQAADVPAVYKPLVYDPPAQRTIFLGGAHASSIVLPIYPAPARAAIH